MKVSDAIVRFFEDQGISHIFGYPGGAVLPLYESMRNSSIEHVLVRNEQSAAHCASGYTRASNKISVCMGTSGPGATNLITGIATAYMDSIPMIIITGQVRTSLIGKDAFQEADIIGSTEPFTKHNYLVKDPNEILRVLNEAIFISSTGRQGPVLIDIPRDVQEADIEYIVPEEIDILGYKPTTEGHSGQRKRILDRIYKSRRPVIYAGGGVIRANAKKELIEFSSSFKIPVLNTLMGLGSFPMDSPLYGGMVGYHGNKHTNEILKNCDLIIIIGARMSDRATKNFSSINPNVDIIHIDIDPAEIGKVFNNRIPIVGDGKNILKKLNLEPKALETEDWINYIGAIKEKPIEINLEPSETIDPRFALSVISEMASDNAIVTADVGQNQLWSARNFSFKKNRSYFTSGGLGTMGYSLPASIGAKIASPEKEVFCVVGDGGIQMLLGELGTLKETNKKVIIILFNNSRLGLVRELQLNAYGKGNYHGISFSNVPDFVKIANAYGIEGVRVTSNDEIENAVSTALESKESYLVEFVVDKDFATL